MLEEGRFFETPKGLEEVVPVFIKHLNQDFFYLLDKRIAELICAILKKVDELI